MTTRIVALILALAMFVIVAHTHENGQTAGRCDVCQAAHVATHQATAPAGIHPPVLEAGIIAEQTFGGHDALFSHIFFTRGPPASSL